MQLRLIFLSIYLFFTLVAQAQPANDDCFNAISLPINNNWCSAIGQFTNIGATPSALTATCFGATNNDVWFSFTAIGTDLNMTINGAGGSLQRPQVALYTGTCNSTTTSLFQIQCASAALGNNIVDLYKGGLVIGQTYIIRIQGFNTNIGTFQICAQNYNAPTVPGSDCISASVLCDKSAFVVQSVTGSGINEVANTCLDVESNSTWFKWTCDQAGSLVFTLTPNNAADDLDFLLYELPNGISDCNGKIELRCMAAGQFAGASTPCHGPTGLNFTSTDVTEPPGCGGGNDNWVRFVNLVSGKSYALVVNNYTSSGNGFQMQFGGTSTFVGPNANFNIAAPADPCTGQAWTFTDNSTFSFGNITAWHWTFGNGASPSSAHTQGAHNVTYNSIGQKSIVLTVETNRGCIITKVININVDSCCQTLNKIHYTSSSNNILCRNSSNGTATITPTTSHLTPYSYHWSNNATTPTASGLNVGNYMVTISNGICTVLDTLTVNGPPIWVLTDNITRPTCDQGTDGAIEVLTISGSNGGAYQYNWNGSGFNNNTSYNNLSNGFYPLVIRDNAGCDTTINYEVHELEIELDPIAAVLNNPTCFGYNNGNLQVIGQNGVPPYQYHWNTGETTAAINNLFVGTYTLDTIWDANRCRNWTPFSFTLVEPDSITISLDTLPVSCAGQPDGQIIPSVFGGTPYYAFLWSNFQQDSIAINLGAGNYTVTVTDSLNCFNTASISLYQPPLLEVDFTLQDVICFGYSDGVIRGIGKGGRPSYLYSLSNGNYNTIDSFNVPQGYHTIYVQDMAGCTANSLPILVNEPQEFFVNAGLDTTIKLGETIEVIATPTFFDFYTYSWSQNSGDITCDTCRRTIMQPVRDKIYYIKITNQNGCFAIDSFYVEVKKDRGVFIPNAFSPNDDGVNDFLDVYSNNNVRQIKNYLIFDRWGELVYQRQNIPRQYKNFGWDGNFKGEKMNSNVFIYSIEIEFIDGETMIFTGDVTLFR